MKTFKKYYPFWLGILIIAYMNSFPSLREFPSMAMFAMFVIGYFKLTKLHEDEPEDYL